MVDALNDIEDKLAAFKRKYYLSLCIRGGILTLSFVLFYFITATITEYNLWLNGFARLGIIILFFCFFLFCIYRFLKAPLLWMLKSKGLTEEQSANVIGQHFPEINDRLINVLQLSKLAGRSALANASIYQKTRSFENISFEKAVDLNDNRQYLRYLGIPVVIIVALVLYNKNIFTNSTARIINFNTEFQPIAPFQFQLLNKDLSAFVNEDFTVRIKVVGESQPESLSILVGSSGQLKLSKDSEGVYSYTFEKVQSEIDFTLMAAGFSSNIYSIKVLNRPELTSLKLSIKYPSYLKQKDVEIVNAGDVELPEGSVIGWKINTIYTQNAIIKFSSSESGNRMESSDNQTFSFKKSFKNSDQYKIDLENNKSYNKDKISHSIEIIKDQNPEINLTIIRDTVLFNHIYLSGQLKDDYGLTELLVRYEIAKGGTSQSGKKNIVISSSSQSTFFYDWRLDSLLLEPGDRLSYYAEVWDNDGINGRKSTKTQTYVFSLPTDLELKDQISKEQLSTESKIDESILKAQELKKSIDDAKQNLKAKQNLDWQDKKKLEEIIQQKEELDKAIDELKKQNNLLEQKKEAFTEENEKIKEKSEQIQKLMDELLDNETKKMFEELQKLVNENTEPSQLQKMLDKINKKELDLEKELERTLELFKELQFDYKVDQAVNQLKDQIKQEEEIQKNTRELANEKNPNSKENSALRDSIASSQAKTNKGLEEIKKTAEELEKLSNELEKQVDTPSKEDLNQIDQHQKESKSELDQKQPKKAAESQKKAIDKLNQVKNDLESSQNSMEMEINMQNLESLRQAVHGLIKLSYDQELTMKDFGNVQQADPKYLTLSQNQIKIKDDAKVLEDSLLAISKRDPLMSNFVIKEIGDLNEHFAKASENIKERRKQNAATEMQLSMTSINNLALMLDDHFNAMMEMISKSKPGKGKNKKKGSEPSLSQLQKKINDKLNELKKGGKGERSYSEEFARMAAEQERIRRALEEMENKMKQQGGKMPGGNLSEEMEKTEMDLVNKRITDQTIKRQQEIMTRLLETEKSLREQNQEEERKGESAKDYAKEVPRAFEEYLKIRQKETEFLKTVPPKLYPYYKKEVTEYFKRIQKDKIQ